MRYLLFLCLLLPQFLAAQSILSGRIWDDDKQPVFGANVYLQKDRGKGAITDLEGKFSLEIEDMDDSLIVSYIGYAELRISLSAINFEEMLELRLKKNSYSLETVQIMARDPITDQFSTVMIKKMDIYLNPVAQGDPLKAITALPASTTIDETANPSLRGSSADRSRVVMNGVPIYNPVRSSQLNNQGFFSIFNPEIMDRQYIYASNPPLTYGNTSA
ncbi:MAG: carboxypeptidase-like regulatory domain-containing protein, partial [Bacteroidota bacterium]